MELIEFQCIILKIIFCAISIHIFCAISIHILKNIFKTSVNKKKSFDLRSLNFTPLERGDQSLKEKFYLLASGANISLWGNFLLVSISHSVILMVFFVSVLLDPCIDIEQMYRYRTTCFCIFSVVKKLGFTVFYVQHFWDSVEVISRSTGLG